MLNAITTTKREKNRPGKTTKIRERGSQEEAVLAFRNDFEGVCTVPSIERYEGEGCWTIIKSVHNDGISIVKHRSSGKNDEIKFPYSGAAITIDSRTFATVVEINGIILTANGYSRGKSRKLYNYLCTLVEMEKKKNVSYLGCNGG